jgi:predicted adenine nucleotide alpha hydrolase (AANH) superfamily ATPase
MSLLQHLDEPLVSVFVHPICEKERRETQTKREIQNIMAEVAQESYTNSSWGPEEILICGRKEGAKRCGRCKVVLVQMTVADVYFVRE